MEYIVVGMIMAIVVLSIFWGYHFIQYYKKGNDEDVRGYDVENHHSEMTRIGVVILAISLGAAALAQYV